MTFAPVLGGAVLAFAVTFDRCGDRACVDGTYEAVLRAGGVALAAILFIPVAVGLLSALGRPLGPSASRAAGRLVVLGTLPFVPWLLLALYAGVAKSD